MTFYVTLFTLVNERRIPVAAALAVMRPHGAPGSAWPVEVALRFGGGKLK